MEKNTANKTTTLSPGKKSNDLDKDFLLALGNDITSVREKNDLITLFKSRIKSKFYFTHIIVTLVDPKDETYTPFLLDNDGSPIREHPRYAEMVATHFSLKDAFITKVLAAHEPVSFILEPIMDLPGMAPFLRVNYEKGVREILMTKLTKAGKTMGFIHVYSDRLDSFTAAFRNVMKNIAPLLSSAVSNIIKNEEILQKEKEKTFLLEFTSAIAQVRTKEELNWVIQNAIHNIDPTYHFIIARINPETQLLNTYIHDLDSQVFKHRMSSNPEKKLRMQVAKLLHNTENTAIDGLQNRILNSGIPQLFNVKREITRGVQSNYVSIWQLLHTENFVGIRLRNAAVNQGILFLNIEQINVELLIGLAAQISIALANILAEEKVRTKQAEQSFLLDFSKDITHIRNREELKSAIFRVLDKIMHTKLAMIRIIHEDGIQMPVFMNDPSLFENGKGSFEKMAAAAVTVKEAYNMEVLASQEGVVFNVEEELKKGNDYARLWKTTGLKNMYALPMRVGNKNTGTIWLLANKLSPLLLKGICAQISIAIANIIASEKLLTYKKQLEEENDYLREQIKIIYNFSEIIGNSANMKEVYRLMRLVADTDTTVLVLGETGTGKELIARAIHGASQRKDKLMVKVNCAALPTHLIESELFGHEKGAFTGAIDRRIGKFELAQNSTIFLDEIGELPLESQAKILRVIQEKELERLGGKQTIKVNVRLIAATNRDLESEVKAGRFRADLYFRLNVFPVLLPPLRDRKEDIEALLHFFINKYSRTTGRKIKKVAASVLHQLRSYSWPGNVRELEHLIERNILLSTDGVLDTIEIPKTTASDQSQEAALMNRSLEDVERSYILQTLKRCGGKISGAGGAAEILQVPGNTLHSKIKKLQIRKSEYFD